MALTAGTAGTAGTGTCNNAGMTSIFAASGATGPGNTYGATTFFVRNLSTSTGNLQVYVNYFGSESEYVTLEPGYDVAFRYADGAISSVKVNAASGTCDLTWAAIAITGYNASLNSR